MNTRFSECSKYISADATAEFLDDIITSRIGVRLVAEQHVSLTQTLAATGIEPENNTRIGVVDLECSPERMIQMCASFVNSLSDATFGVSPPLMIDGIVGANFTYVLLFSIPEVLLFTPPLTVYSRYIPVHLEYILTEILKNAVRASVEHHQSTRSTSSLPPVQVTIAPSSTFLSLIRIRDQGGGIHPNSLSSHMPSSLEKETLQFDPDYDEGSGGGP